MQIDHDAVTPPFEQLRQQFIDRIARGELQPGDKLPTVRGLATELGLAANTVARTYRELEASGYLRTAGRSGTFVAEPEFSTSELSAAATLTTSYVAEMRRLGFDPDHIRQQLSRALDQ